MYQTKSMDYLCTLFEKSRQAYYDNKNRKEEEQMQNVMVLKEVEQIRKDHKRLGTEKIQIKIQPFLDEHHIQLGRDKLYDLLRDHGLLIRVKCYKPRTTDSNHPYYKYSNLVRNLHIDHPCQLWVSDITYISTQYGFIYLSLITDCYSHKIVGWCLHPDLTSKGVLNALDMALESNKEHPGLIHHSDRGIQYCCSDYVKSLEREKIVISMTQNGDPYENALAERVNGILKMEYGLYDTFKDYFGALEQVKKAIDLYNNQRPHMSCDMMTPSQAHQRDGVLKKRWKPRSMIAQ